jgi:hypothetical protein
MLAVYLFSLILGGGFLLLSVLGGEGEVDVDVDIDVDVDTGDVGGDGADAARLLSFRTVVYALFAFGGTGVLLDRVGITGAPALATSLATGAVAGIGVGGLFAWLGRTESGDVPGDETLVGRPARVTLPLSRQRPGTVVVERGGRRISLRALPHATAEGDPEAWRHVVVIDVDGGVVLVAPADDALLGAGGSDA